MLKEPKGLQFGWLIATTGADGYCCAVLMVIVVETEIHPLAFFTVRL